MVLFKTHCPYNTITKTWWPFTSQCKYSQQHSSKCVMKQEDWVSLGLLFSDSFSTTSQPANLAPQMLKSGVKGWSILQSLAKSWIGDYLGKYGSWRLHLWADMKWCKPTLAYIAVVSIAIAHSQTIRNLCFEYWQEIVLIEALISRSRRQCEAIIVCKKRWWAALNMVDESTFRTIGTHAWRREVAAQLQQHQCISSDDFLTW